nr:MAG TPA: hypothetical protein [Caudoviricetes sp.]
MKRLDELTLKELNQRNRVLCRLKLVLDAATGDDISIFDAGDVIILDHGNGKAQRACVIDDSPLEMAIDILKAVHHGDYFDYPSKEDELDED